MQYISSILSLASFSLLAQSAVAANNDDSGYSCPGVLSSTDDSSSVCCVGGTLDLTSDCPDFPFCTESAAMSQPGAPQTETLMSCATVVPVTASNYDQLISSLSASLQASGTQIRTTISAAGGNNGADATGITISGATATVINISGKSATNQIAPTATAGGQGQSTSSSSSTKSSGDRTAVTSTKVSFALAALTCMVGSGLVFLGMM